MYVKVQQIIIILLLHQKSYWARAYRQSFNELFFFVSNACRNFFMEVYLFSDDSTKVKYPNHSILFSLEYFMKPLHIFEQVLL